MSRCITFLFLFWSVLILAQEVPGKEENIPFLITFGKNGKTSFGDDDFKQAMFFTIPASHKSPFYIRIFDPGVGGLYDEKINGFDTETRFSFFGGRGIYSSIIGKNAISRSETAMGDLLFDETFDDDEDYDKTWYKVGPFNPSEGEYVAHMDAYVFKMLAEGISGDDGNTYRYFLSSSSSLNIPIAGANAFTFEYTVRLHDSNKEVSHLYPYIDKNVIAIKQHNFDLDGACHISIQSVMKPGERAVTSNDNHWADSRHRILDQERESCLDFRIINSKSGTAQNNNVVLSITNQYGEALPFMAVPLGEFKYSGDPSFIKN